MPRSPQWFQDVPTALQQLREVSAPVVDRAGLEKLLRVSRRDAIRLLHRFGGYQAGRTFLIGREDLIRALKGIQAGETFAYESRRRQRLVDDFEDVRRDLRARQVKLPVTATPASGASLPSGMRITRPGVLEVEFTTGEDLLARLYKLVRIAGDDLESFDNLLQSVT